MRCVSICVLVVTGVSSFPVIGLLCFHIVLICRGRTTNEQVNFASVFSVNFSYQRPGLEKG